jgi:hypothetical protein
MTFKKYSAVLSLQTVIDDLSYAVKLFKKLVLVFALRPVLQGYVSAI